MTVPAPTVLALLAARRGAPTGPDGVVRAMPVVLRIERPPAPRTPVLEAAARAALALCLDPRAQQDGGTGPGPDARPDGPAESPGPVPAGAGEWHAAVAAWIAGGRIRKIARRARTAHWAAVQELPGVTVTVGDAQARALLPGPVDAVAREVARLQIGGTDLPADDPGPPPPGVPVIWVNGALGMTVGKAAAQVGHAAMLDAAARGLTAVAPYAVRTAEPSTWARLCAAAERGEVTAVRDAGFTEVAPGTITAVTAPG